LEGKRKSDPAEAGAPEIEAGMIPTRSLLEALESLLTAGADVHLAEYRDSAGILLSELRKDGWKIAPPVERIRA
jgi:hypothetical protein